MATCGQCKGTGLMTIWDAQKGWIKVTCNHCGGSGSR